MKLYKCYNGYRGYSKVRVLVVAPSEEEAKELAAESFKKDQESRIHGSSYWSDLEVELLCDDLSQSWASGVSDG